MGKIKVSWSEGGKPYCHDFRLFSGWNLAIRFNWYPQDARLIKCILDEGSRFVYNLNGRKVGEYEVKHCDYTAKMYSIENLIKVGVTGI